jgi:hypothetical protein
MESGASAVTQKGVRGVSFKIKGVSVQFIKKGVRGFSCNIKGVRGVSCNKKGDQGRQL